MQKILSALIAALIVGAAVADTHYVDLNNPSPALPYTNGWGSAANTITAAVYNAQTVAGDVVLVNTGVYVLGATISIAKGITLIANSINRQDVVIDGASTYPCVDFGAASGTGTGRLEGFTIRNGNGTAGLAAGVRCWPSSAAGVIYTVANCTIISNVNLLAMTAGVALYTNGLLTNCTIQANYSRGGGAGVFCNGGGVIRNCVISGNTTTNAYGGGVYFYTPYSGKIFDSIVSNNYTPSYGGGIYAAGCIVSNCAIVDNISGANGGGGVAVAGAVLQNCAIERNNSTNASSGQGGGVYFISGTLMQNCVIKDNMARMAGGGIKIYENNCIVRNCLIVNNSATNNGGGISFDYGTAGLGNLIQNCTIASNAAGGSGGGLYLASIAAVTNFIENTIIYYNSAGNTYTNWRGLGVYYFTNSCIAPTNNNNGSGNIAADPSFVDKAGNYRLSRGSLCINAGTNVNWMANAVDLDGRARIYQRDGGIVDIGAYEFIPQGIVFQTY